jgi:hypothetical protein
VTAEQVAADARIAVTRVRYTAPDLLAGAREALLP